jgi:heterodisulfide reductase subunit C
MSEHPSPSPDGAQGDARHARTLAREIEEQTGLAAARCYQCGKCSAGCPMATESPLRPHEMVRLVQLDRRERLLTSEAPWLCLGCETCTARCPNGFDPALMVDAVREIVWRGCPESVPRPLRAFHAAFLDQIRSHGRVFELGLVASYKLRSGKLFDDVLTVPGLLRRGKLGFVPQRVTNTAEMDRIFARCEAERVGHGPGEPTRPDEETPELEAAHATGQATEAAR